ncbi:hypothetical protein [Fuscibacter oryzae]|uniref:Uncharacterized protein n=1 Tax=Fuscibacter oryzae TaxID=2803939 RepID=A0A8J7MQI8_9RHOB|nr:hypothetical protein [Fuscibacter oryzae]MBL4929370.1 hypothetical protein [Fuscibacter oryzae]
MDFPKDAAMADDHAVDAFAMMMKAKLASSRAKGRGGWQTCSPDRLVLMFSEHLGKTNAGNWVDLANLAMMIHLRETMDGQAATPLDPKTSAAWWVADVIADLKPGVSYTKDQIAQRIAAHLDWANACNGARPAVGAV